MKPMLLATKKSARKAAPKKAKKASKKAAKKHGWFDWGNRPKETAGRGRR